MVQGIDAIMQTTMENLLQMIDISTVVGTPIDTGTGTTIIPVSRAGFGFVAGGGEYKLGKNGAQSVPASLPFAGGAGAGVGISPVGFLVVCGDSVRMVSAHMPDALDRLIEMIPDMAQNIKSALSTLCCKEDEKSAKDDEKYVL